MSPRVRPNHFSFFKSKGIPIFFYLLLVKWIPINHGVGKISSDLLTEQGSIVRILFIQMLFSNNYHMNKHYSCLGGCGKFTWDSLEIISLGYPPTYPSFFRSFFSFWDGRDRTKILLWIFWDGRNGIFYFWDGRDGT